MLNLAPKAGETVSSMYNASLPTEYTSANDKARSLPPTVPVEQVETLKKELDNRDSTISELKSQLKNLQTIVEQLTKENSVLKVPADDTQSTSSQISIQNTTTNGSDNVKLQERGKSMETDQLTRENEDAAEFKQVLKSTQRPVSMYEPREGPKNNWQVTKHQVLILLIFIRFTPIGSKK